MRARMRATGGGSRATSVMISGEAAPGAAAAVVSDSVSGPRLGAVPVIEGAPRSFTTMSE
jgi:hypothetical protein